MDGNGQSYGGLGSQYAQAKMQAVAGNSLGQFGAATAPPPPQTSIGDLVGTAENALQRLYGLAESVDNLGDKLIGASPHLNSDGSTSGVGGGSLGQLASYLSMIHATITRIERGASRLHEIHG